MTRRSIASGNALTDELVAVVCNETGQTKEAVLAIVRPIAKYLDREYGGQNIYKKSGKREAGDLLSRVQRDLKNNVPKRVICRIHGIGTSTLYRLLNDAQSPPSGDSVAA